MPTRYLDLLERMARVSRVVSTSGGALLSARAARLLARSLEEPGLPPVGPIALEELLGVVAESELQRSRPDPDGRSDAVLPLSGCDGRRRSVMLVILVEPSR